MLNSEMLASYIPTQEYVLVNVVLHAVMSLTLTRMQKFEFINGYMFVPIDKLIKESSEGTVEPPTYDTMADKCLNFDIGPNLKPFMDNSFNLFVQRSGDGGIYFNPMKEGGVNATTNVKEELVTGIPQTTQGNASTGEMVTGMLSDSVKSQNQGNHTPS